MPTAVLEIAGIAVVLVVVIAVLSIFVIRRENNPPALPTIRPETELDRILFARQRESEQQEAKERISAEIASEKAITRQIEEEISIVLPLLIASKRADPLTESLVIHTRRDGL